ncbi:MAG: amidohydrolase [Arthrobacter sp.]|jgi:hippurate hydrolase|nr:amidohydrolase [Arthrobacter sp.]
MSTQAPTRSLPAFREDAERILPELVKLRRALHTDPELGMDLPRTQARVVEHLASLGLEITASTRHGGVTAVLRGARPGPTVLLRADMDALPMAEQTGLDYASTNGSMHACGHDLHVAGLAGAATVLSARREDLAGTVVFMFQPGEELGEGAATLVAEGVIDAAGTRADAAYGIHVVPGEYGVFSTKPGPLMAGCLEFDVQILGRGGHASAPHLTVDPVPAVAELVGALQAFATRRFDAFDPIVLSVTRLRAGGEALNIIEDTATLSATVRVLSEAATRRVKDELPGVVESIAAAHGCTATLELREVCPPTVNDPLVAEGALETLRGAFGEERVRVSPAPVMGSEDFSHVLREVPGAFVFLRATPAHLDPEMVAPNHSPFVVFDDAILADQAAALASLAWRHVG